MMRTTPIMMILVSLLLSTAAGGDEPTPPGLPLARGGTVAYPSSEPLFSRHVVAVLSRLGCNAGGNCHGAVKGQNGFRLSLWGSHPNDDYAALLRAAGGRRVNLLDVDASLVLLKPTARLPHGGGKRTDVGSPEFQILRRWLQQGANLDDVEQSRVIQYRISPREKVARSGESFQLHVEATFADGSVEDVTPLCSYESEEKPVATVDENGKVTVHRSGETPIFIRYRGTPLVSRVLVPVELTVATSANRDSEVGVPRAFIDEHVLAKLKRLNVHPSAACDDATFLRRASLDIAAALPTPDEIRRFLADNDPAKRAKKIDELLKRPGHAALWATIWCDMIRPVGFNHNHGFLKQAEVRRFYEWIRARLAENTPYDEFVERMLTATSFEGRSADQWVDEIMAFGMENVSLSPDLNTYARRRTLDLYWQRSGEEVLGVRGALKAGYLFMGLRLECAQCHRHPHDIWQQEEVLDFANFFNQTKGTRYPVDPQLKDQLEVRWKAVKRESKEYNEKAKKIDEKLKELRKQNKTKTDEYAAAQSEHERLRRKSSELREGAKRFGSNVRHEPGNKRWVSVTSPLGTQRSQQYRFLGATDPIEMPPDKDPRELVVDWLRDHETNPYFARALVNRVWAHYFGRGIVDPPDNLSLMNPPTHPELLKQLADEFVAQKYDLRWLHRTITSSQSYQHSGETNDSNRDDRKNYASFYLRRMSAEVLVDAVNSATGGSVVYPEGLFMAPGAKAVELPGLTASAKYRGGNASSDFAFQLFGRPKRDLMMMCDCERDAGITVMHTLYLANNPRVRDKIADPKGRVAQVVEQLSDDRARIEEIFLWTVSRPPSESELASSMEYMNQAESTQKGLEDVLWSLLNTREFILIH